MAVEDDDYTDARVAGDIHVTHHLGQGLAGFLFLALTLLVLWSVLAVALAGEALADHPTPSPPNSERTINLQPPILNAIARCESGGIADIHNRTNGVASGLFQFLPSTWDLVAHRDGRHRLEGVNPSQATLAQQIRLATSLLASAGTSPWNASKHCWLGASQRPIVVSGDRQTLARKKCRRSMRNRWAYSRAQARRICRAPDTQGRGGNA